MSYYHVWFVTKYRKGILEGETEQFVKTMFAECIERHGYNILEMETNKDHAHLLVEAKDRTELAEIVKTLKSVSARETLRTPHFRVGNARHLWARRYGSRKIAESEIAYIRDYIRNQQRIPHTVVCGGV